MNNPRDPRRYDINPADRPEFDVEKPSILFAQGEPKPQMGTKSILVGLIIVGVMGMIAWIAATLFNR
ncbi:MAG: hypothetical protein AB7V18_19180 [Pyrinomonadaceae bacterium]